MTRPDVSRRAADEDLLWLIGERCRGASSRELSDETGLSPEWIRTATHRVRAADEAQSGEDVTGCYWPAPRWGRCA